MVDYRISESAKEDLIRIHHYGVKTFGLAQADKYFNSLFKHFESIASNPLAFEAVDHIRIGYRRSICGVDSIYYRISDETVEIMAILGKQNWLSLP